MALIDEGEFRGPVRRKVGGRAKGEMDVGRKSGVTGKETRFDVNTVELYRLGEV